MPPPSLVRSPARRTRAASSSSGCCRETGSPRAPRDRELKSGQSGLWTSKLFQLLVIPGHAEARTRNLDFRVRCYRIAPDVTVSTLFRGPVSPSYSQVASLVYDLCQLRVRHVGTA